MVLCSTAGEILGTSVAEDSLSLTAILFESTEVDCVSASITDASESKAVALDLAKQLDPERLRHVFVFSDGLLVNGSALAEGLNEVLPEQVVATGGLVGDGADFGNPARNDGRSTIEIGYHDGDFNNFQPITNGTGFLFYVGLYHHEDSFYENLGNHHPVPGYF